MTERCRTSNPTRWRPPMIMDNASTFVIEHYRSRWGEPSRTAEFHRGDRSVQILKWSAGKTSEGVAIYATAGISDYPLGPLNESHRTEVIIGLLPEEDRIARPLSVLALNSQPDNPYFLHGHTVRYEEPLWAGTELCGFLLTNPRETIVPDLTVHGLHVHFLHAMALFPAELDYEKATSAAALLDAWEERRLPFWDPTREPYAPSTPAA